MFISLDTETTGLDLFHGSAPFMVCTLSEEEEKRTWEWSVDPLSREVKPDQESLDDLCHYIDGKDVVFHHADFDLRALDRIGIKVEAPLFPGHKEPRARVVKLNSIHDTQLLSHVVNTQGTGFSSDDYGRHALKPLALHYLNISEGDETRLQKATVAARRIGKSLGWKLGTSLDGESQVKADYWMPAACWRWDDEQVPEDWLTLCKSYCQQDCFRTLALFFFLQEIMESEGLQKPYNRELRLLPVTYNMEHFGLHCEKSNVSKVYDGLVESAEKYKAESQSLISVLNVNSGQQLAEELIKMGVPVTARTKPSKNFPAGQWQTNAETLTGLAQHCELHGPKEAANALRLIVGWNPEYGDKLDENGEEREVATPGYKTFLTGSGYCKSYLFYRDSKGCIHPSYNPVGTAWTRYSCSKPNGQNVGKKAVLPLRRCFGPPPGYVWFAIDYSQLELRIYAYATNDKGLIQSFADGYDFHTFTAMNMFDCGEDEITSERRRSAKYVNFGVIFGAGSAKIDQQSGKPGTYKMYMDKFPNARQAMAEVMRQVRTRGWVETLFGYRLWVPEAKPYAAMNGVVQGTAGDVVKNAMVAISEKELVDWAPPTKDLPYGGSSIVGNIHDELVIQIPMCYPYKAIGKRIMKEMEKAGSDLGMVTPVDAKLITTNWGEGEKFAA